MDEIINTVYHLKQNPNQLYIDSSKYLRHVTIMANELQNMMKIKAELDKLSDMVNKMRGA